MRKLIGIISYFPNNTDIKNNRKNKLINLIYKCKYLFNLPIYIVIQNWGEEDIRKISSLPNVILSQNYNCLGITGARKKLREYFINSTYDYLIMLDDDCELKGNSGTKYLEQIDFNPNCFIEYRGTLLKLFAISKSLLSQIDYDNINPEDGDGFEDRVFVGKLRLLYPENRRQFINCGIEEESISTKDVYSTWYSNQDLKSMIDKSINKIDALKEK